MVTEDQIRNELCHHGILGQKWGVRRYQDKSGKLTSAGKSRKEQSTEKQNDAKNFVSSNGNKKVSDLASGDGEVLAAYAVTLVAYAATMYATAKISAKIHRKKTNEEFEQLNKDKTIKSFSDVPKLSKKTDPAESMKNTNPEFPSEGTTMNCTFCTTAMALREKGYDVKASKSDHGWYTDDLFGKAFDSPSVKIKAKNGDDVLKALSDNGDGAYGNLTVSWNMGGAHSVFWKNEGGNTRIYDGQSGLEMTESAYTKNKFMSAINTRQIEYNRLDNCDPTAYALATIEKAS